MEHEKKEHIERFYHATVKRMTELVNKPKLTRAERYELDMCIKDAERAEKALGK